MTAETHLTPGMHIHLIGIGGAGMSAIARVLLGRGYQVSGSDQRINPLTQTLAAEGVVVYEGHRSDQVQAADLVVMSSAVPADNPEVVAARKLQIPVMKRAEFIGELMIGYTGIAIAGTHGKTTTTGMLAHVLLQAGLDPTVILGGTLPELGGNGRFGRGDLFVVEADEYDHMFLGLRPELAVITNIEHDHPDIFPTPTAYLQAFQQFVGVVSTNGKLFVCSEDPGVLDFLSTSLPADIDITTYGLGHTNGTNQPQPTIQALDLRPNQMGGTDFIVNVKGTTLGLARLRVPGEHNVRNALAATAVGLNLGLDFARICRALADFGGVQRRFQVLGEISGVTIIDDYAHHPTEIKATLAAARQRYPGRRIWAVWQPHTFSRTRLLVDQFAESFVLADRVIALDIYRSRESDDQSVNTADVVTRMNHPHVVHIPEREAAAAYLLERIIPDDVLLTLGAGDGNLVGEWVLKGLQEQHEGKR